MTDRVEGEGYDLHFIHDLADVKTNAIGLGTKIWQFCVVLEGAKIGKDVNICSHCFIENDVAIGDNVTVKNGVYVFDGVDIESDVFVGPGVLFTNDKKPRSKIYPDKFLRTRVCKGASIGAGVVVLPGLVIGANSIIGAGSVVTKNVPENAVIYGESSRVHSFLDE